MFKGLKALFAGILAGTAVGILFSPKKGEEIRQNFKKEFKEGGTGLKTAKETLTKMGQEISETSKDTYQEISKTEGFKKAKKAAKKFVDEKVPAKTKKQAQKALSKAKKSLGKAKKAVEKVADQVQKITKKR